MEMFGTFVAGLGLFLVGIKGLGTHLQLLAGGRMRRLLGTATRSAPRSAALGVMLGALTQSSNAATFISTSLVQAGILALPRAMLIVGFANIGTAGLVLLATVDLHLAALWLVGVVGFLSTRNLGRASPLRPALGALLGLALLFLGIDLMKLGATPLRDLAAVREVLAAASGGIAALAIACLAGAVVAMVAQSSSTVTILALAMHEAGVLDFEQALLVACGASVGSGLAVLLLSSDLRGTSRRLAIYQALIKAAGAVLFILLLAVEHASGLPLLLGLSAVAEDPQTRLAWLFLALQLVSALALSPFGAATERLLARLSPETQAEALSRPRYIYEQALAEPVTALDLVAREQRRLLNRLPVLADRLRAEPEAPEAPQAAMLEASEALEARIGIFLKDILSRGCGPEQLDRAVALEAALDGLRALRETLGEFSEVAAGIGPAEAATLLPVIHRLAEALHLLLGELAEFGGAGDAESLALLGTLTADRSDMMDGLRRRLARDEPNLPYAAQDVLFRATSLFERMVWLTRRQALLLAPAPG
jgi:phosphate:Na+ symporter